MQRQLSKQAWTRVRAAPRSTEFRQQRQRAAAARQRHAVPGKRPVPPRSGPERAVQQAASGGYRAGAEPPRLRERAEAGRDHARANGWESQASSAAGAVKRRSQGPPARRGGEKGVSTASRRARPDDADAAKQRPNARRHHLPRGVSTRVAGSAEGARPVRNGIRRPGVPASKVHASTPTLPRPASDHDTATRAQGPNGPGQRVATRDPEHPQQGPERQQQAGNRRGQLPPRNRPTPSFTPASAAVERAPQQRAPERHSEKRKRSPAPERRGRGGRRRSERSPGRGPPGQSVLAPERRPAAGSGAASASRAGQRRTVRSQAHEPEAGRERSRCPSPRGQKRGSAISSWRGPPARPSAPRSAVRPTRREKRGGAGGAWGVEPVRGFMTAARVGKPTQPQHQSTEARIEGRQPEVAGHVA